MKRRPILQLAAAACAFSAIAWTFYEGPDPEFHSKLLTGKDAAASGDDDAKPAAPFVPADDRTSVELADPVRLTHTDANTGNPVPIDIGLLSNIAHAGPTIADIDGDGDRDLLVGDFPGNFWHFDNRGTEQNPVYVSLGQLQAGGVAAKTPVY